MEPELIGFADRLGLHNEKKRKIKYQHVFGVSNMCNGGIVRQDWKKDLFRRRLGKSGNLMF